MAAIIKIKSLFELYSNYDKKLINLILKYLKKEEITITILKQEFGPNFDGIDAKGLSYFENLRLKNILIRISDLLKFADLLIKNEGKTINEVKEILENKTDLELISYMKNVFKNYQEQNESSSLEQKVDSLQDFMKVNNLTLKDIKEIIEFHENADEKIALEYKYGIGKNKIDEDKIAVILKVDVETIQKYIENVLNALPKMLISYNKSKKLLSEYNIKESKTKTNLDVVQPKNRQQGLNVQKNISVKDKSKRKLIQFLITEEELANLTQEQIEELQNKLNKIVEVKEKSSKKAFEILRNLTNNNLLSEVDFSKVLKSEKQNFYDAIKIINTYIKLSSEEFEQKLNEKKKNQTKKKLIDYLTDQELTQEQIEELQTKLNKIIEYKENSIKKSFEILKLVTNNNLFSEVDLSEISEDQRKLFYGALRIIKPYFAMSMEELTEIFNSDSHKKDNKTLLEYFTNKSLNSEQLEKLQNEINRVIEERSNEAIKAYEVLKAVTNYSLTSIVNFKSLSKRDKNNFHKSIRDIKEHCDLSEYGEFDYNKSEDSKKKLIDYLFGKEELTQEQIEELQTKLNIIVIIKANVQPLSVLKEITDYDLFSIVNLKNLSKKQKQDFYDALYTIKPYLNKSVKELKDLLKNSNNTRLIDCLVEEELTSEQIDCLQNKLKVKFTLQNYDFSQSYNLLFQNNELNLRSIINLSKLNEDEKKSFEKAIIKLKEYIMQILSTPIIDDNRNVYEMMQTDLIIYKAINQGKMPEEISDENQISLNTIIESFIRNIRNYNVISVIKYICNCFPEYLSELLNSKYFSLYMQELTDIEKRIIYLKLLSISNKDITNEYIANLLGLSAEDIENYEIMSKHDEINILNLVFKQNN